MADKPDEKKQPEHFGIYGSLFAGGLEYNPGSIGPWFYERSPVEASIEAQNEIGRLAKLALETVSPREEIELGRIDGIGISPSKQGS